MSFKSKQKRWMFANHPAMAREWADQTPDIKALPESAAGRAWPGLEQNCQSPAGHADRCQLASAQELTLMSRQDADRNLLFGITALQNDFISRDALIAAMNAWALEKHRPLGEILVERHALDPGDRDALEAMIARRLLKHYGDPTASLAALSSIESTASALRRSIADSDILASIGQVSTESRLDPDSTRAPQTVDYAPIATRYRKVRDHAKGGLGIVYVARDEELRREVALKEIQDRHADDPGKRARFLVEAEITGGLEHPGIVPVYGLGAYDDGRPFYAMRFIKGDSLKDAIRSFHADETLKRDPGARSLALQKLLRRFLDVCNAIDYAHSRGVLHRDLKPDNVMVGRYGETLVVDWGLAKAIGRSGEDGYGELPQSTILYTSASGSAETLPGSVIGTPAYMSPEQAAGRLDLLGPASDVYSLGATLYTLLTGRVPFADRDLTEILRKVERGDFPRPRESTLWLDPALESICLKAMATRPEERYASPGTLAGDLERWLADEPVATHRDPWTRRARRWAKRNRTLVTAAVASLLVGLVGLGSVAAVQTKANANLKAANAALDQQRIRAEKNEDQAIAAVRRFADVLFFEPELKNNATLERLRKRLLKEPLAFFRNLRDRLQADHDIRPESLVRLADASFELGQMTSEIGDKQDALVAYREALLIRQKLAEENPDFTEFQSKLSNIHNNMGLLLIAIGQTDQAMKTYQSALTIRQKLADENPTDTEFQNNLAMSHNNIGILLSDTGQNALALKTYQSALTIRQKLADENPSVTEFQNNLAGSHNNIGLLLTATGQTAKALKAYQSALTIRQKLAHDHPAITQFQSDLALSHNNVGALLSDTGQTEQALKAYQSALAIRQKLSDENPTVTQFQSRLAGSHNNIGNLLSNTGQPDRALKAYQSAVAIQQKLADDNPTDTKFQSTLATSHNNVGLLLTATGQTDQALKAHQSSLAIRQKLFDENSTTTEFEHNLAMSHNNIGLLLTATGQTQQALKAHQSALTIRQKLADENPTVTQFQNDLANSHNNIGTLLRKTGQTAETLKAYQSALTIRQKLADENPTVTEFQNNLATIHNNIGLHQSDTGQPAQALKTYQSAFLIYQNLAREHPESPEYASCLGATLNNMAILDFNAKRFKDTRDRLHEAIEWQRKALAANPGNPTYRRNLTYHWSVLLKAAQGLGDADGVTEAERELVGLRDSDPVIVALDARLASIIKGDQQPKDNPDRLQLAQRAYDKGLHALAAKLWGEAMDANPKVAESRKPQFRYNAACAAALAGCGQGKDEPAPDDAAKAKLREQARGWLQAELSVWTKFVESGPPQSRTEIVQILQHWKEDTDLAGVREAKALEGLPESEREPWRNLWVGLDALLIKAQAGPAGSK